MPPKKTDDAPRLMAKRHADESARKQQRKKAKLTSTPSKLNLAEQDKAIPPVDDTSRNLSLEQLSLPPTFDELCHFKSMGARKLPVQYKRHPEERVFVNRSLRLDKIKYYGFDMDYTLAVYTREFESLAYDVVVKRLVGLGYPEQLLELKYDPDFAIRGLFVDKEHGNLLKIGQWGNIVVCYHGRKRLSKREMVTVYPSLQVHKDDIGRRYEVLDTLFSQPECCLLADMIDVLEKVPTCEIEDNCGEVPASTGTTAEVKEDVQLSYTHLYQDLRNAVDHVHRSGELKSATIADLDRYVVRDQQRLSTLLDRMRHVGGAKLFLLTNSEYYYTKAVMTYLLSSPDKSWKEYFDVIITSARKPSFFSEGSTFREVNLKTGNLKVGKKHTQFDKGAVYCGGSLQLFNQLTGAKGNEVLYVGDHIFSDIIQSKRTIFWRTLLVVPEVGAEVARAADAQPLRDHLENLSFIQAELFRGCTSESVRRPDAKTLQQHIKATERSLSAIYNKYWGSTFQDGMQTTFFAMQVQRFADLYTADFLNLLHYPFYYLFIQSANYMPHSYFAALSDDVEESASAEQTTPGSNKKKKK